MEEKLFGQMEIAKKVRAVDMNDVAQLVIQKHFLRDIKGNLRKFSMQQFLSGLQNLKEIEALAETRCFLNINSKKDLLDMKELWNHDDIFTL